MLALIRKKSFRQVEAQAAQREQASGEEIFQPLESQLLEKERLVCRGIRHLAITTPLHIIGIAEGRCSSLPHDAGPSRELAGAFSILVWFFPA